MTERHNGLRSRYAYDAGGRLHHLRHTKGRQTLADFRYEVDKRGNRTQAQELLAHPATTTDTTIAYDDKSLVTTGTWSDVNGFKVTTQFSARLMLGFFGDEATLTMGTGPDHSIYDIYIDGSLWQSFDGYAASEGQRGILITMGVDSRKLAHEGPHVLEIRNRAERHPDASGHKLRFKQLVVADKTYALHTIRYDYDDLARLTEARYAPGINAGAGDADLLRRYQYSYDLAGNRAQQIETMAGSPTTTNYIYNAANQMTAAGGATLTYDDNGNLTSDGANSYVWDRANRLLSMGGVSYAYDGLNNRVSQTISSTVTQYLLDLQPGLSVVLAATTGANTDRYIHGPRGIHAQCDAADNWEWMVQDGLGSVRGVADNTGAVLWCGSYADYGTPYDEVGTPQTIYGFTGEPTNETGLVHLRARDYNPALGIFTALDPFEGMAQRPMSLNGYSWVEGNTINSTDPSGMVTNIHIAIRANRGFCGVNQQAGEDRCQYCLGLEHVWCTLFEGAPCPPPTGLPLPMPTPAPTPSPTSTPDPLALYETITRETVSYFMRANEMDCLVRAVQNEIGTVGSGLEQQAEWVTWAILNRRAVTRELDYRSNPNGGGNCGSNGVYNHCAADCRAVEVVPTVRNAVQATVARFSYRSLSSDPTFGGAGWRQNPNSPEAGQTWAQLGVSPCGDFFCRERSESFPDRTVVASCGGPNYVETVDQFYDRVQARQTGYNTFYSASRRSTRFNLTRDEAQQLLGGCVDRIFVTTVNTCDAGSDGDNICWITQNNQFRP